MRAQAREVRANQEQGRPVYNVVFLDSDVLVVQPLSEVFDPSFARRVSNNSHSTFAVGTTIAQAGILTSKVAGPSFCARADMQAPNAMVHSFLCVRLTGMFVVCGSAYVCMLVFACVRVPMLAFLTRCIQLLWRMGSLFRDWVVLYERVHDVPATDSTSEQSGPWKLCLDRVRGNDCLV